MPAVEMHVNGKRVFVAAAEPGGFQMIAGSLQWHLQPIAGIDAPAIAMLMSMTSDRLQGSDPFSSMRNSSSPAIGLNVGDSVTFKIVESGQSNLGPSRATLQHDGDIVECNVDSKGRGLLSPDDLPSV